LFITTCIEKQCSRSLNLKKKKNKITELAKLNRYEIAKLE